MTKLSKEATERFFKTYSEVEELIEETLVPSLSSFHEVCIDSIEIEGDEVITMVSLKRRAQPSKCRKITGGTNIFGRCIEVGGNKPKAVIQLHGDQSNLLVKLTKELAKPLGRRLYEDVVIEGNAVWDAETLKLLEFEATEISTYQGGNVVTAFKELAEAAGGRWDNVDAQEYVRELRDDEEDEDAERSD